MMVAGRVEFVSVPGEIMYVLLLYILYMCIL